MMQPHGLAWMFLLGFALLPQVLVATPITVKNREGTYHGFVVLRSADGKMLATGDALQTLKGDRVYSELLLHFKDGSLHDEKTVFTQGHQFRLISDHLTQEGPSFPDGVECDIDAATGQVSVRGKDGKEKQTRLHLAEDVSNGLLITLLKNLPESGDTTVTMVSADSKPRVVKFSFRPRGEESFSAGGAAHKALHFVGHIDVGGVAGVVASITGKQPADVDFWVSSGKAPAFIKFLGPLYNGGPVWSIELAAPRLEDEKTASERE